jgi:hypothetical protein
VNPLRVARQLGKFGDHRLCDHQPIADTDLLARERFQFLRVTNRPHHSVIA